MTKNEFKLFCIYFCKKYEGKTFGEVLPDINPIIYDIVINTESIRFSLSGNFGVNENYFIYVFFNNTKCYYFSEYDSNKRVNIPDNILKFEDIV